MAKSPAPPSFLFDLRQRLEYVALRAVISAVRLMPLEMATGISARAWRFIARRNRRHKRALSNLARAMPEKTAEEREAIALAMWENLGRVMAETVHLDRILAEPGRIFIENHDLIDRYRNKLGPSVFTSLHMGNWEIAIAPLNKMGSRVAGVYRLVENPYVDRYLREKRSAVFPGGLFAKGQNDGLATVLGVAAHIRGGGSLGLLADLVDWKGVQVPFFGHMSYATTAPGWLARRVGARLWVGRCLRIGKESRFKIAVKEIRVPRSADADADIRAVTAEIQRQFEAWIREHPEQWMWSNKRWPDEEARRRLWGDG